MKKINTLAGIAVLAILLLSACGKKNPAKVYEDTIAALPEDEYTATVDIGLEYPVLLTTDEVYDDGSGDEAAIYCDVYYPVDKKVQKIGSVESMGTAYPIACSRDGIYSVLDGGVQNYTADASGKRAMTQNIYVSYDEQGNAAYFSGDGSSAQSVSADVYDSAQDAYTKCTVVSFTQKQVK